MQPPFHCPVRQQTLRWWTGSPARRPTHPELSLSFGCFGLKARPKGLRRLQDVVSRNIETVTSESCGIIEYI